MKGLLLRVHDYLASHRLLALLLLVLLLAAGIFGTTRLRYEEDISKFLPHSGESTRSATVFESLGNQGKITVLFRPAEGATREDVMETIDLFAEAVDSNLHVLARVDESHAMAAIEQVGENIALYLTEDDYRRIDTLLSDSTYIARKLAEQKQVLSMPVPSIVVRTIAADPLDLFSPALSRLESLNPSANFDVEDGYLFDQEGNGYAFLTSPYGSADTRHNGELAERLQRHIDTVKAAVEGRVKVSAVGAPLIAATNAQQIKHDSFVSTLIAILLIAAVLWFSMPRRRNVLWMAFSLVCGWIFALAVISVFKTEISIIVVGIGSVLLGIAVNYPLHYLDHLKECPDRRETLKEMIEPLVTGNVTTVAAFACLLFVKAEAMRDLGLFASLLLLGTIAFVMVFLPLWARAGCSRSLGSAEECKEVQGSAGSPGRGKWRFWIIVAITAVLGYFSTGVEFDSDLHNINYMTAEQKADLDLLSSQMGEEELTYVVAEGRDLEEALERNDSLNLPGVASLLPSVSRQERSLKGWERMKENYPDLVERVEREARKAGFAEGAFEPFYRRVRNTEFEIRNYEEGGIPAVAEDYVVRADTGVFVVNYVSSGSSEECKGVQGSAGEFEELPEGTFAFTQGDVGSSLVSALNDDFNYILFVCSLVVFLFLWLALGRLELALLAFLPMAMGWLWILGLMALTGIKFNIVNVILATFIFGQGDDYTIFITEGLMYEYAYGRKRLKLYRRSVILSAVLMTVGIGVLVIAKHPAMRSLGEVAVVGMASVIVMACVVPPLVFNWLTTKGGRRRDVPLTLRRLLYTGWIILVFVLFALVIFTPYTIFYRLIGRDSERKRERYHRTIYRCAAFALRHLPGVKYHLHNERGETFEKPAVIIANHQSHLDLLCILSLTPKVVVLTNDWVWRNPVYGAIIRYAEFYPASNGFDSNLPRLKRLMERGYSVVVFPEGTRSVDGSIGRFHKGAFALAQACGVDVLEVYLHGNSDVMPKNDIVLRQGTIDMAIGRRYAVSGTPQEMRADFVTEYERFCAKVETEDYFRPWVRYQYLYKGREVARRRPGEEALQKALAHPAEHVVVELESEEERLVVERIKNAEIGIQNLEIRALTVKP